MADRCKLFWFEGYPSREYFSSLTDGRLFLFFPSLYDHIEALCYRLFACLPMALQKSVTTMSALDEASPVLLRHRQPSNQTYWMVSLTCHVNLPTPPVLSQEVFPPPGRPQSLWVKNKGFPSLPVSDKPCFNLFVHYFLDLHCCNIQCGELKNVKINLSVMCFN